MPHGAVDCPLVAECTRPTCFTVSRRSKTFDLRGRQLCGGIVQRYTRPGAARRGFLANVPSALQSCRWGGAGSRDRLGSLGFLLAGLLMAGKVCKCCVPNRDADDIQRQRRSPSNVWRRGI
jgi:hypothetical protein